MSYIILSRIKACETLIKLASDSHIIALNMERVLVALFQCIGHFIPTSIHEKYNKI